VSVSRIEEWQNAANSNDYKPRHIQLSLFTREYGYGSTHS
jgi:hypothetical protein